MSKWHNNVDLLQHTCSCGRFQYSGVYCGHTIAVIRAAERGAPQGFVLYNLTVPSLCAAYIPVAPVEIAGLEVRYANSSPAGGGAGRRWSGLHSTGPRASRNLGEDHKRRFARQVNKSTPCQFSECCPGC